MGLRVNELFQTIYNHAANYPRTLGNVLFDPFAIVLKYG